MSGRASTPPPNNEPLSISEDLNVPGGPVLVRKITRPKKWQGPLDSGDVEAAIGVFASSSDSGISLFLVNSDSDLRRVALALNEYTVSPRQRLTLLPIRPEELSAAGVGYEQTLGASKCPVAADLHYDMTGGKQELVRLCRLLLDAKRDVGGCSRGNMKLALELSKAEGCFVAVPDSASCACGAER